MEKETIIAKTYDLIKVALPILEKIKRSYKFTLGDRIQIFLTELLERMLEAFYAPAPEKIQILIRVNLLLEKLRYFLRLGFELSLYNMAAYKDLVTRIDEIGRMTGGWIKSLKK